MEKREGYKQTPLGWIPEEWKVDSLSEVSVYVDYRGKTPLKSNKGIFLVTAKNIKNGKINYKISQEFIPEATYEEVMRRGLPKIGDILITTEAPLGEVAEIDKENVSLAQRVIKLRGNEDILLNRFLKYFLMSDKFQNCLKLDSTGSTVKGIKGSRLKKLPVCLPPLLEQQKIAAILSTVDEKIESIETGIDAAQQLKKGLMQQLLTRGIGHKKFKETFIGKIPKKWEVVKLINLSVSGIKNGAFNDPKRVGKGYKLINVVNLYSEPYIKTDNLELLDLDKNEFIKYEVKKEDIFFTRSSLKLEGIAHCNINLSEEKDLIYECHIMRLRPDKTKVNPYYLRYYCISYPARKYFMSHAKQVTMTTISQSDIASMPIPIPSIHEQKKIAEILVTMDEKLDILREKKEGYQALKKGLMQQLLTGNIRVSTSPAA